MFGISKILDEIDNLKSRITNIDRKLNTVDVLLDTICRQYEYGGSVTIEAEHIMPGDVIAGRQVISVTPYFNYGRREQAFVIEFDNGDRTTHFESTLVLVNRPDMITRKNDD